MSSLVGTATHILDSPLVGLHLSHHVQHYLFYPQVDEYSVPDLDIEGLRQEHFEDLCLIHQTAVQLISITGCCWSKCLVIDAELLAKLQKQKCCLLVICTNDRQEESISTCHLWPCDRRSHDATPAADVFKQTHHMVTRGTLPFQPRRSMAPTHIVPFTHRPGLQHVNDSEVEPFSHKLFAKLPDFIFKSSCILVQFETANLAVIKVRS